jgi:hypothetical protein
VKIKIELSSFEAKVLQAALRDKSVNEGVFKRTCSELFIKIDDHRIIQLKEKPSVWRLSFLDSKQQQQNK